MQNIVVNLECSMGDSFRCQKAADSVNLDPSTKDKHSLSISTDGFGDFNIGVILGSSGSGKTTLARKLFGDGFEKTLLDPSRPVIDQFPEAMPYDDCVGALTGMGLTSIPCWIRPAYTLSNGQRARAEAALRLSGDEKEITVIDEWTSVVDRSTAKIMSHRIQKEARRKGKKVILLSCHYDVIDWINPDFIIDCNNQSYVNRKASGEVEAHQRQDTLRLEVRACSRESWRLFSKYHYLSANLAPDTKFTFGLFHGKEQVGFCAFTRYAFKDMKMLHSNRVVVHPDYVGLGLGIKMVDECSQYLCGLGFKVRAKFTSRAMLKARIKNPRWRLIKKEQVTSIEQNKVGAMQTDGKKISEKQTASRNAAKLYYVTYFTFAYVPKPG